MRKIITIALLIGMLVLLTVPAFADGRGPAFTTYDVVCRTTVTKYREEWNDGNVEMIPDGSYASGTVLTVQYEYENHGVLYGEVYFTDGEESSGYGFVRLSDVDMKNNKYLPTKDDAMLSSSTVRVTARGGVTMYAGPNEQYPAVTTIPRGTKLTYSYSNDADAYYRTWAYVTYLNHSGWIYVYASDPDNGVVVLPDPDETAEIWVLRDDVQMFDGYSPGNHKLMENQDLAEEDADIAQTPDRIVGTLEKGKKYTYRYSHVDYYGGTWYNVTAGLRSGWVYAGEYIPAVAVNKQKTQKDFFMTYQTTKLSLLDVPENDAASTTVTLPPNTTLSPTYQTQNDGELFFYVALQEHSGWFSYETAWSNMAIRVTEQEISDGYYETSNAGDRPVPMYSTVTNAAKTVGAIPLGGDFTPLYTFYDYEQTNDKGWRNVWYVRYNGVNGWVDSEAMRPVYAEDEEETQTTDDAQEEEERNWSVSWSEYDPESEREEEDDAYTYVGSSSPSPLQIVLMCVGGAAVLALTAAVTLVLIRRKRSAKMPATKEPQTVEAPTRDDDTDRQE